MMLERETDDWLKELDRSLGRQGLNLDNYLEMQKLTEEEFRQEVSPQVEERLKRSLALGKLVELEDLDTESDETAGKALERLAAIARGELEEEEPSLNEKAPSEEETESTEQQAIENESERSEIE
jgi:FKBP-type peptidyl-prolyl cis-trans isomerase (trigger factor)